MKKKRTIGQKIKRFSLILLVIILAAAIGSGFFAYYANFSEGSRSGIVQKISKKGVVFKTYEGQMDIGGLQATQGGKMTSVFEFSVDDDQKQLIKMLEEVSATGERVTLKYEEKFFQFPWRGDTKYFVVELERPNRKTEPETQPEPATPEPDETQPESETETPDTEETSPRTDPDPRDV